MLCNVKYLDLEKMEDSYERQLEDAVRKRNIPLLKDLLNTGVSANMIVDTYRCGPDLPLFIAIKRYDIEIVKILLEYGANPNTLYDAFWVKQNAVHLIGKEGSSVMFEEHVEIEKRFEILKLLLMYGGDINSRDQKGRTLVHKLVMHNVCFLDELLYKVIPLGVDVNIKDNEGNTPLFYACDEMNNWYLIPTLIKAGANVNTVNNKGETIIVSLIKKLNYYKRCGIKYSNATNDNWHNYIKEDYFLKGHMKRSHKKDVEIVIKMLAKHGARLDGCRSAKFLDKIKVIPDDVLGIIDSYIGEDPIEVAIGNGYMECAELLAGMRGVDLGIYKKRHRIV